MFGCLTYIYASTTQSLATFFGQDLKTVSIWSGQTKSPQSQI